jgi:hypothetical protein
MMIDMNDETAGRPRKTKKVVMQRKVTAAEYEQHKERMESLGLDANDPVPRSLPGDPLERPGYGDMMRPPAAPATSSGGGGGLGPPPVSFGEQTQATKPSNVLRNTGKKTQKTVSLQRRTIEEQNQAERHERALAKWDEQQKEWENFRHKASAKLGRQKEELVVTRAEEYRERLEVHELLDRATPDEIKSGGASWYHSLRGDGTRFVQIGNMFTGLFLPIKMHKENYQHEIIRKPLLRELHERRNALLDEGAKPNTWRDEEMLVTRQKRYGKKMHDLMPGKLDFHETLEPEVIPLSGAGRLPSSASMEPSTSDVRPLSAQFDGDPSPFDGAGETDAETLQSILGPVVEEPAGSDQSFLGPNLVMTPNKLQFNADIGTTSTLSINIKNVGTTVVQYEWKLNEPEQKFEESVLPTDPTSRFRCEQAKGELLPGRETNTHFIFISEQPGTFLCSWRLNTCPQLMETVTNVFMHGVALKTDLLLERRQIFQKAVHDQQVLHNVQEIISDIVKAVDLVPQPPPDLSSVRVQERLFNERNHSLELYWSPHAWETFVNLQKRVEDLKAKKPQAAVGKAAAKKSAQSNMRVFGRGRLPVKKPDPGPPPRPPEELAPSPIVMLRDLAQVPSITRGQVAQAGAKELETYYEKQELSIEIPRSVRAAKVRPLERSPIWAAAYETVMELVLSVPRFAAHSRKYAGLEALPFILPPSADADTEADAAFNEQLAARRTSRFEQSDEIREKETKANESFLKTFAKMRFGPAIERFSDVANEASLVASLCRLPARFPSVRDRLRPYLSRQNSESVEMSGNVVIYEANLEFLASLRSDKVLTPQEQASLLSPEAVEQVKQRLSGLSSVLEMNPLAILVVAHVGMPAPDPFPEPSAEAGDVQAPASDELAAEGEAEDAEALRLRKTEEAVRKIREQDAEHLNAVQTRMSSLFSLEALLDSVKEACEPAATVVEFVPHATWLGDIEGFGDRIRKDETENKVFLLENLSAIPEEVGIVRISQIPPKKEEAPPDPKAKPSRKSDKVEIPADEPPPDPPAPKVLLLPWATREAWANRVFRRMLPEVLVQDSFDASSQSFTIDTGIWPGAPLRVTGPTVEAEFATLVETLPSLERVRDGAAEDSAVADEDAEGSPAPMLIAIGGGGFHKPGGENELIQKLKLIMGLSQFNSLEKYGVILALGGEIAVCVIADLLGVKVGSRNFQPSRAAIAAIRATFLEVLVKSEAKVAVPIDLCCEEYIEGAPVAKDGDTSRTSHSLASAFAALATAPASLGVLDGKEYWVLADPQTGILTATTVAPTSAEDVDAEAVSSDGVPDSWLVRDIGDASVENLLGLLKKCRGVLWNGVLGVWEADDRWQQGTRRLLANVESRLLGAEDEEEDEGGEEDEEDEGEEGDEKPERQKAEPDAEFEVALVIGRDSAQQLPNLMETPSLVQFVSQSGDALLQMLRGEEVPGLLVCAERTAN